jgi:hypothetical protein
MKITKKQKITNTQKKKYLFSFLERRINMEFLIKMKFQLGYQYNNTMTFFSIGVRRQLSVYNLYSFTSQLKKLLHLIYLHSYSRELVVCQAINQHSNVGIGHHFYFLSNGWLPGFLTNFRRLIRRILAERRYQRTSRLTPRFPYAFRSRPHLPTMAISLSGLNYGFLNESSKLKIVHIAALDRDLPNYNTSSSLLLPNSYVPISIMVRIICETVFAAKLTDRLFCTTDYIEKKQKMEKSRIEVLYSKRNMYHPIIKNIRDILKGKKKKKI